MALDSNRLLKPVKKLHKRVKKLDRHWERGDLPDLRNERSLLRPLLMKDLKRWPKQAGKARNMDALTPHLSVSQRYESRRSLIPTCRSPNLS